jgi:AcrR family transcriptional regulator
LIENEAKESTPKAVDTGKRSRTRKKLIEAAAAVIGEKGFDRASLDEIAASAGMTRGAVYGNFKNKDELFLALIEALWKPIIPPLKQGASLKEQMGILGRTVAQEARLRRSHAAAAAAFQLYALTHEKIRSLITEKNRAIYQYIAQELVKIIPETDLPMPAERFVCVLDTMITGLLFTYFQTPDLITQEIFISAFEALAPPEK